MVEQRQRASPQEVRREGSGLTEAAVGERRVRHGVTDDGRLCYWAITIMLIVRVDRPSHSEHQPYITHVLDLDQLRQLRAGVGAQVVVAQQLVEAHAQRVGHGGEEEDEAPVSWPQSTRDESDLDAMAWMKDKGCVMKGWGGQLYPGPAEAAALG